MSPDEFTPPSHAEDVRRGLGQTEASEEPQERTPQDVALEKLADALRREFTFMNAEDEGWARAAGGVLGKLGAEVTSGEGGVVIVTIP